MTIETKKRRGRAKDRGRVPYRFTAEKVLKMIETGIYTARADGVVKFSRYAARGIPVNWIIKAKRRFVQVYDTPQGRGKSARYTYMRTYSGAEAIAVVIDGREVGSVIAADLFPEDQPS